MPRAIDTFRFCPSCGAANPNAAKFCPECGTAMQAERQAPPAPAPKGSQTFGSVAATVWRVFWSIAMIVVILGFIFYLISL